MGFWQGVLEFVGGVAEGYINNESYKSGFLDGYNGNPRNQALITTDYYNAGYKDGQSARESGVTFE